MPDTQAPQLLLDILPTAEPTLDNFVAGPNVEAAAALRSLRPGRAVYLWGPEGCGRSHLLRAGARQVADAVVFDPAAPAAAMQAAAAATPGPGLIAVDDLHRMDEHQLAAVFALYNHWRESAATRHACILLVTGDRAPLQMPLREDLRTRLGWDLVFRLELLSDDDKRAALHAHAASRALDVAPDIFDWLLTRHSRDMRQLISVLDALDRYSLATKRPATLPLLKTMLAARAPAGLS